MFFLFYMCVYEGFDCSRFTNMIASDNSSDDEGMSMRKSQESVDSEIHIKSEQPIGKFKSDGEDSLLRRAIKENESSIIQIILSPSPLSTLYVNETSENENTIWCKPRVEANSGKVLSSGPIDALSLLIEFLFEAGHLTRIEYDRVEKAVGANSAAEQAQLLTNLLLNSKCVQVKPSILC